MQSEDIAQVLEIERESFPTMWPPTAYKRELEQNRLAHYLVTVERNGESAGEWASHGGGYGHGSDHPGAIGRLFGELRHILGNEEDELPLPPLEQRAELITGVIGVWLLADEAHIVTIAVRESHRRQGIAELLLIRAIELAGAKEQQLVTLECRVSNTPTSSALIAWARALSRHGFRGSRTSTRAAGGTLTSKRKLDGGC